MFYRPGVPSSSVPRVVEQELFAAGRGGLFGSVSCLSRAALQYIDDPMRLFLGVHGGSNVLGPGTPHI